MNELFVSDLDGTLLNDQQEIDKESVQILNELIEEGLNFTIATARSFESVRHIIRGLNLKLPVVLMNGVFVYDLINKCNLVSYYISQSSIRRLLVMLTDYGFHPLVSTINDCGEQKVYYQGIYNRSEENYLNSRLKNGDKRFKLIKTYKECMGERVIEINVIEELSKLEAMNLKQEIERDPECICHLGPDIYTPGYGWLEITNFKATKKQGIMYLKEKYQVKRLISFGDNLNDLPMFEISDEKYAVRNAHEGLKRVADRIIESNNENGVIRFLQERFGKLQEVVNLW